jgi:NADPH:quinone reductase
MKAARIHACGGPEVFVIEDVPDPVPGVGEVLVRVELAGVNFIDVYQRRGEYRVNTPVVLGQEAAGTVVDLGPDVIGFHAGDRVAWCNVLGAYAELALVPAPSLVSVPAEVTSRQAAAAMLQGMTAHYLATTTYPLTSGDTCLVHAAAGGVGLLLCQIAKNRGARVIGTVSTDEKADLAKSAGAEHVIVYTRESFEAEVSSLTTGAGVQVVYDSVGRTTFDGSLQCLAPRGMMVLFGQSSGAVPPFDPRRLNERGALFLTRPSLRYYTATRGELLARSADVLEWIREGAIRLRIGGEYPLSRIADAHRDLESRRSTGKLLIRPGES